MNSLRPMPEMLFVAQPGKHRRSFSSSKTGGADMAAAALRAVQSAEPGTGTTQPASAFGIASGASTEPGGLCPVLDFEQARFYTSLIWWDA